MNLFKAAIVCEQCGEIHAERWLTSTNRHATNTTLFVLCESCKENELRVQMEEEDFDPFEESPEQYEERTRRCHECNHVFGAHHGNCSQFDPIEAAEYYYNGGH